MNFVVVICVVTLRYPYLSIVDRIQFQLLRNLNRYKVRFPYSIDYRLITMLVAQRCISTIGTFLAQVIEPTLRLERIVYI